MIDNWEVAYHVNVSMLHMYVYTYFCNKSMPILCVCVYTCIYIWEYINVYIYHGVDVYIFLCIRVYMCGHIYIYRQ